MKKIRFVDGTETEIYDISDSGKVLSIQILNGDSNEMETKFSDKENLSTIKYFVGTDLIKGYARYTNLTHYIKEKNKVISIDYETPDSETDSGFAEEKADVLTMYIAREENASLDALAAKVTKNTSDIAEVKEAMTAIDKAMKGGE